MKSIVSPTALAVMAGVLVMGTAIQSHAAARFDPPMQERTAAQKKADEARRKQAERKLQEARSRVEKLRKELDAAERKMVEAMRAAGKDRDTHLDAHRAEVERARAKVLESRAKLMQENSRNMALKGIDSEKIKAILEKRQHNEVHNERIKALLDKVNASELKMQRLSQKDKGHLDKIAADELSKARHEADKALQEKMKAHKELMDKVQEQQTQFDATVAKAVAAAPDFVFYGGYPREAAPLFRQLVQAGVTAQLLGADGLYDPALAENTSESLDEPNTSSGAEKLALSSGPTRKPSL